MRFDIFSIGLSLLFSFSVQAEVSKQEPSLADITCKLYGPQGDWKYQNIATVNAVLKKSDLGKATRNGTQPSGCKDDEFLVPSVSSKGGQAEISIVANICGDSDVYWFARIRSKTLFPELGQLSFGINPTTYNRLNLGSEGEKEDKVEIDGQKFKFLYFDCRPTSLFKN